MTSAPGPSFVFRRTARPLPVLVRARGVELWDSAGRRYLDGCGGAVVVNVGHGREEVIAAMAGQAAAVSYVHGTQFTTEVVEDYARRLAPHAPGDCRWLYLVSGGSEALETAIKLARAYHLARGEPRRHKVVARSIAYHGATLGALSLSFRPALQEPYRPMLADVPRAAVPFCYHCPLERTFPECDVACVDDLARVIERAGAETVSAFVAEPIIGASAGAAVPPEDYARRARAICDRFGVLYIDDEVMAGFGRTGRWFGIEWSGAAPDIVVAGKGMSGGYAPVGGVMASGRIVETVAAAGGFAHGFTFSHNPVTAAACRAVLDILEREDLVARAERMGEPARKGLEALRVHPHVGDVRGRGLMFGIELVADRQARRPFPRSERRAERLAERAREEGLLLYPSGGCADGHDGDVVMFAPPLVVTSEELEEMVDLLDRALTASGL